MNRKQLIKTSNSSYEVTYEVELPSGIDTYSCENNCKDCIKRCSLGNYMIVGEC